MVFNKQTIFDFMDDVNKAIQEFAVAMEAVIISYSVEYQKIEIRYYPANAIADVRPVMSILVGDASELRRITAGVRKSTNC